MSRATFALSAALLVPTLAGTGGVARAQIAPPFFEEATSTIVEAGALTVSASCLSPTDTQTLVLPLGQVDGVGTGGPFGGDQYREYCVTAWPGAWGCVYVTPSAVTTENSLGQLSVSAGAGVSIDSAMFCGNATAQLEPKVAIEFDLSVSGPSLVLPPGALAHVLVEVRATQTGQPIESPLILGTAKVGSLAEIAIPPPLGFPEGFTGRWTRDLGVTPVGPDGLQARVEFSSEVFPDGVEAQLEVQFFVIYRGSVGPWAPFGPASGTVVTPPEPTYCVFPDAFPFPPSLDVAEVSPSKWRFTTSGTGGQDIVAIGLGLLPLPIPALGYGIPPLLGCGLAIDPLIVSSVDNFELDVPPLMSGLEISAQGFFLPGLPELSFVAGFTAPRKILLNW